jgi:predicted TIM-barrel fold metal-dependent hydrolase
MIGPRLLGDEAFTGFFAAAEALDIPVGLHDVTGAYDMPWQQLFSTFYATKVILRPFAFMTALLSLMNDGVLERYPRLRIALLENGAAWLPYWIDRLDEGFERWRADETPWLRRPPSEYLRRGQIFCHCEGDERDLPETIAHLGEDVCFFASDFPHAEAKGNELSSLRDHPDLTPRAKAGILAQNAIRLYGASRLGLAAQPAAATA